jgi:(S)-sulfolactate dehydrogenase
MRVVITEFMDEDAVSALAARCDVTYDATLVDRHEDLLASLADADAVVVRNKTQVTRASWLRVHDSLWAAWVWVSITASWARPAVEVIPASGANAWRSPSM